MNRMMGLLFWLGWAASPSLTADEGNWPSFRGPFASGVADGPELPVLWNAGTGENMRFRVEVAGLTRLRPYMPTPLIYRGLVYVLNNDGPFACNDLQTGAERYRVRMPHLGDGFSASPVAGYGRLYLASESGEVLVFDAGDTFREPVSHRLGEPILAIPALSDGVIYVRGSRHLFAIGGATE